MQSWDFGNERKSEREEKENSCDEFSEIKGNTKKREKNRYGKFWKLKKIQKEINKWSRKILEIKGNTKKNSHGKFWKLREIRKKEKNSHGIFQKLKKIRKKKKKQSWKILQIEESAKI